MTFLTLTTSTDRGGVALFKGGKLLKEKSWTRKMRQSEAVVQALAGLLKTTKLTPKDIEAIVLDIGPGSFTGTRISANLAKTLAQSTGIPIYTTTSLDCLLFQNGKKEKVTAVMDAHKALFYVMSGDGAVELLSQQELESRAAGTVVAGVFTKELATEFKKKKIKIAATSKANFPLASTLGKMFLTQSPRLKKQDWKSVEPLYIRAPAV